ncbi:MAG: histidine kinase [Bacteroidetes bacterium]|nr:histidine kinase [Bacteroidota bacterium]
MRNLSLLLVLFFASGITPLAGQNHFFRKYDSRQGLPSSEVYYGLQDDDGYMWFSTDHGLVRYDGYQFKTYDVYDGLPENPIFILHKDFRNRVWFVTLNGLLGYHHKGRIYPYQFNDKLHSYISDTLRATYNLITDYEIDHQGSLWFSLRNTGLFRIDSSGQIMKMNPRRKNRTTMLVPAADGRLMIDFAALPISDTLIVQWPDAPADTFNVSKYFKSKIFVHHYNLLHQGPDIYYSEKDVLLHIRKGRIVGARKLPYAIIRMGFDHDGRIWLSTQGGGGRLLDRELNEIEVFLDGEPISSFCRDQEGGLWFTSLNSGIFYIPEQQNKVIVPPNMYRQDKIIDLKYDKKGTLWYASFAVFGGFDASQNQIHRLKTAGDTVISAIQPDPDGRRLWVGTNRGLLCLDTKTNTYLPIMAALRQPWKNYGVKNLHMDTTSGILWVGTYAGFYGLKNGDIWVPNTGEGITHRVEALETAPDGRVFVGSQKGLYLYANGRLEKQLQFGLPETRITALRYRNDSLWIGTRQAGLMLLTPDTLIKFGRQSGLPSSSVSFLEFKGNLLVAGTNRGISIVAPDHRSGDSLRLIQNITAGYGLLANEVSAMTVGNNRIVAASAGFISFLVPDTNLLQRIRMPCHITAVAAGRLQVRDFDQRIELKYSDNNLIINYFAISFFLQERHTYRHRLLGLESEWVVNQQTTAAYPFLPPGNYVFEVEVRNPDGSWSPASEKIFVRVLKPYWKQWWFIALMVLTGILLMSGIVYLVGRQILRQRNLLNDMWRFQQEALALQMNPHFIFNALNTVQRFIVENDKLASSRYLSRFAGFMRAMLDNAQKPDTSLAAEMQLLGQYLELESARAHQSFTYAITCDPQIDTEKTLIPVFLIQPLVENAIQHGLKALESGGKIELRFRLEGQDLLAEVEDNGIGRAAAAKLRPEKKSSLGLPITEKRIFLINKSRQTQIRLEITDLFSESGQAAGTLARLRFPGHAKTKTHG